MKCKRIIFTIIASLFSLMSYADLEDHGKDYSIDDNSDSGWGVKIIIFIIIIIIYATHNKNDY